MSLKTYTLTITRTVEEEFSILASDIDEANEIGDEIMSDRDEYVPDSYAEYDSHVSRVEEVAP